MRGWVVAIASCALVSCGPANEGTPPSAAKQASVNPDDPLAKLFQKMLKGDGRPDADSASRQEAPASPPERSLGVYSRGAELDPNDLGALARITEACGGPWARDFLNEPLALQNGRAVRDGNVLTIGEGRFENPFAELSGEYGPRDMDAWEYHYFGTYTGAGAGLDVVHVQYSEGNGYILADRETLSLAEFQSLPSPSPSGKYFAATSASDMIGSFVEVAERTPQGVKTIATIESDRFPCGLTWISDSKATFRELGPEAGPRFSGYWDEDSRSFYRDAAIELRDGVWTYLPAK